MTKKGAGFRILLLTNLREPAFVDKCKYKDAKKEKWYWNSGYVTTVSRPRVSLHEYLFGKAPKGFEWDHRNRNRLDNQEHNLRLSTHSQNMQNRERQRNNTSGYIGVYRGSHRWRAMIRIGGRRIWLRRSTAEEAARARDAVAFRHHGKFAVLNFPIQRFPRYKQCHTKS